MRSLVIPFVVFVSIAACAGPNDVLLTDEDYDEVALAIGTTTLAGGELGAMTDVLELASGRMPLGFAVGADGGYHGERQGRTYDYSVTCHDLEDRLLAMCGSDTDRAHATVTWSGGIELPLVKSATAREASWDFAAITTGTATLAGSSALTYDTEQQFPERGFASTSHFGYLADYQAIVIDPTTRRPTAGSIHYAVDVEHTQTHEGGDVASRAFEVAAEVMFVSDGSAAITIADRRYQVDALTGLVTRS